MKTIGVSTAQDSLGLWRTLNALSELMDVRFEERRLGVDKGLDAWVYSDADLETLHHIGKNELPCYVVISDDQRIPCGMSSDVEFSDRPELPSVLRGRRIRADEVIKLKALPRTENMTALASKGGLPVWSMKEVGVQHHHFVALPIPDLNEGEPLFQSFNRNQFIQLLPLLLFLRTLKEDPHWEEPPLQACFMFDDPNLHWPSYGFIDYGDIAVHAQRHNYHVCFATIPQDAWFFHRPTARLFKLYRDQLSLLIHGNNHSVKELARLDSDEERKSNLVQALQRIGGFERRCGLEVSRVMAPPHGACSELTLREMACLGFEAACISRGSLRHYNRHASWLPTLGMKPSDIIEGLPVFSRFPLSGRCHNSILIAALLHQPIIAMGHHHDVAGGTQILDGLAEFVNSLGTVNWGNMRKISRSHFARRFDGSVLQIRMHTRRIEIVVPEGVSHILIQRPWLKVPGSVPFAWKGLNDAFDWKVHSADEPIPVLSGQSIEIRSEPAMSSLIYASNGRKYHIWPIVRRQITEARDRLVPMLRKVSMFSMRVKE